MRQRYENESHSQQMALSVFVGSRCFLCVKDTKMKAIHNRYCVVPSDYRVVFYASKIRKWKPFTTRQHLILLSQLLFSMRQRYENESHSQPPLTQLFDCWCCFLCVKDTKMKAIHNGIFYLHWLVPVVFYASKIRKWKPFTTGMPDGGIAPELFSMRQRYENESHSQLKVAASNTSMSLFSMRQRYENESHSQRTFVSQSVHWRCFLCVKDTKMKAIHN